MQNDEVEAPVECVRDGKRFIKLRTSRLLNERGVDPSAAAHFRLTAGKEG
jgi:hypothetical protein